MDITACDGMDISACDRMDISASAALTTGNEVDGAGADFMS